jgi:hypothetical protein
MTSSQDWGLARRIGFRFGIVFGALVLYPFPLSVLPELDWLTGPLHKPLEWATLWFAQAVLGLPEPAIAFNGSGDRTFDYVQLLLFATLGVIGAVVWSALDRRRSYPRLAAAAHVVLRYSLACAMLSYGLSKVFRFQFSDLSPYNLRTVLADSSPMGLLWKFMDYSAPYTRFGGLCEAIPGFLLLWRRTATIGAVMVIAVMTNVVMLNLCYDVPVKLYSTRLLVMAGLIAVPDARRLLAAALGRAAAEVPARVRMSPRRERVRQIAKAAFLLAVAVELALRFDGRRRNDPDNELYGNWVVDTFSADGVERPPLTTDPLRWQSVTANKTAVAIWLMSGDSDPPATGRRMYPWKVDAASHTITVTLEKQDETWHYARPDPDHLVIDGVHLGASLHVTLHARPSELMTRGFHWINEKPFNR